MEPITVTHPTRRLHPLIAGAALSVIAFAVAGTAAVTGLLPSSKADPAPQAAGAPLAAAQQGAPATGALPAPASNLTVAAAASEPPGAAVAPKPAPKPAPRVVHHVVHHTSAPAPQPVVQQQQQPNYLAIGAGALVGGVIGHQIGGGRGRDLATVAGAIGGGIAGNELAKQRQQ
ncbi:MAG TPA: glycine zipper 2TM domain-containing protein [Telluria sp.]|nr:glycine zipper 2TM domain-containing protein [Telluria sp.]